MSAALPELTEQLVVVGIEDDEEYDALPLFLHVRCHNGQFRIEVLFEELWAVTRADMRATLKCTYNSLLELRATNSTKVPVMAVLTLEGQLHLTGLEV